jgi:hypothetical protein
MVIHHIASIIFNTRNMVDNVLLAVGIDSNNAYY